MKVTTYIIIAFTFAFTSTAFTQTLRAYEREAKKAFENNDYAIALAYYKEALDIDSTKVENIYRLAEAARQIESLRIAEENYQKVADRRATDEYRLTDYHLAMVQKGRGEYKEAIANFQKFIADYDQNAYVDDALVEDAKAQIVQCQRAKEIVDNALTYVEVENVRGLNTANSEFAAVPKDQWLYFGRLFFEDEEDSYKASRAILGAFRSPDFDTAYTVPFFDRNEIHTAYSPDGRLLFFTDCTFIKAGDYRCDLYVVQQETDGDWGEPQKLPFNDAAFSTTQPNVGVLANGETWLFFASDRPGGTGKMDLYYCKIAPDGSIGEPVELKVLNTYEEEVTPFFHSPSQTLFFSTDGRKTLGELDIYESTLEDGKWSTPQALGYPLNSSYNDNYYLLTEAGDTAFFSSNRAGSEYKLEAYETCCPDIYRGIFDIAVELTVNSTCATYRDLPQVRYSLFDAENNALLTEASLNADFTLKTGNRYLIRAEKEGFSPDTMTVSTRGIIRPDTLSAQLDLYPQDNATFHLYDKVLEEPLTGVDVKIYSSGDIYFQIEMNNEESSFNCTVEPNREYTLIAQKKSFLPDTLEFDTYDLEAYCSGFQQNIYLNEEIPTYLPITLYFFNDQPEPRTYATTTDSSYTEIFEVYFAKLPTFKREHRKGVQFTTDIQRDSAEMAVEGFFRDSVQMGYDRLGLFAESVLAFLERGRIVEVPIQGFASPLAGAQYNTNLSMRRIASIGNFFREYDGGVFVKYMENNALQFRGNPQGENDDRTRQQQAALENLNDKANTVYSPLASEGRRIQITELNFLDDKNSTSLNN